MHYLWRQNPNSFAAWLKTTKGPKKKLLKHAIRWHQNDQIHFDTLESFYKSLQTSEIAKKIAGVNLRAAFKKLRSLSPYFKILPPYFPILVTNEICDPWLCHESIAVGTSYTDITYYQYDTIWEKDKWGAGLISNLIHEMLHAAMYWHQEDTDENVDHGDRFFELYFLVLEDIIRLKNLEIDEEDIIEEMEDTGNSYSQCKADIITGIIGSIIDENNMLPRLIK